MTKIFHLNKRNQLLNCSNVNLRTNRPRLVRMCRRLVVARQAWREYRPKFQASCAHSDSANWPSEFLLWLVTKEDKCYLLLLKFTEFGAIV